MDSGQYLKRHHHQNANQNSAAATLTKNKQQIKTYTYFFWWWCHYLHVPPPPYVTFVTKFGYLPPRTPVTSFLNGLIQKFLMQPLNTSKSVKVLWIFGEEKTSRQSEGLG